MKTRSAAGTIIRNCIVRRKIAAKTSKQVLVQLPADRLRPGVVFENAGMDYAGPALVKSGRMRRPVIMKAYIAISLCFSMKAVHIVPV